MKENGKCSLLMGAYYITACLILGYAAYYLEYSGLSSVATGLIVSGSCMIGALLQAVAGTLVALIAVKVGGRGDKTNSE